MQSSSYEGPLAKISNGPRIKQDLSKVSAGLARGPFKGKTTNPAAWSNTWPAPGATLDLDFANNRGFVRGVGQGGAMDAVTFTRASSGNWVDSTGLLRTGAGTFTGTANATAVNLLSNPQDFDNAIWTKYFLTISPNVTLAPDNTNTADFVQEDNTNNYRRVYQLTSAIAVASSTQTVSVYVKDNGCRWIRLETYEGSTGGTNVYYSVFDLTNVVAGATGVQGSGSGVFVSSSITNANNGWYRCTLTYTTSTNAGGTQSNFGIYLLRGVGNVGSNTASSNSIYQGNGVSGIYIWGAQLERGSTATTYYPTNINAPRFDWASTAQLPGNLIPYSETLDNAAWTKLNITASAAVSGVTTLTPVGGVSSGQIAISSANGAVVIPTNGNATISVKIKPTGTARYVSVSLGNMTGTNAVVRLDLQTGVFGAGSGTLTGPDADGFYSLSFVSAIADDGTGLVNFVICPSTSTNVWTTTDATAVVQIKEFQIRVGSTVLPYLATGAQLPINTPLAANPTSNGLLIEESRTNRLLWCRDATQTNWTKTNVTAAKTATGIDGVANAASTLTASADNGTCIEQITLASGSRTSSVYLKRITGTGNIQVTLDGTTWSTVDLSNGLWNRIVLSGTVTNPAVGIRIATNGDAVALDYGQIEDGAFATTPILTTTATATRAVDAATMLGTSFTQWFSQNSSTIYAQFKVLSAASSAPTIWYLNGQSYNLRVFNETNSTIRLYTQAAAVSIGSSYSQYSIGNSATSWTYQDRMLASLSGSEPLTGSTASRGIYTGLYIGSAGGSFFLTGYISRLVYFPQYTSAAGLKTISGGAT